MQFIQNYWLWILIAIAVLAFMIWAWIRYRRWVWQNMFGIAFLNCVAFSIPTIRVNFVDLVNLELVNESPHWMVTVVCAVLHFLTVRIVQQNESLAAYEKLIQRLEESRLNAWSRDYIDAPLGEKAAKEAKGRSVLWHSRQALFVSQMFGVGFWVWGPRESPKSVSPEHPQSHKR